MESDGEEVVVALLTLDGHELVTERGALVDGRATVRALLVEDTPLVLLVAVDDDRWFLTRIG